MIIQASRPAPLATRAIYDRSQPQRRRFFTLQSASTVVPRNRRDVLLRIAGQPPAPLRRPLAQLGELLSGGATDVTIPAGIADAIAAAIGATPAALATADQAEAFAQALGVTGAARHRETAPWPP